MCVYVCVCRVGRRISCHQLVSGAGHTPGQPTVRPVESHSWRLSVGLCSAGHVGNLRQGLGSPQDPPWQPPRLLPLVSPSSHENLKNAFFTTWKAEMFRVSSLQSVFEALVGPWLRVLRVNTELVFDLTNWDFYKKLRSNNSEGWGESCYLSRQDLTC